MSVENIDIEAMTEVWNSWAEINRQKDAEIRKLKEANSGSVINLRLKILKEENKKLGEKNEKLKEENDNWEADDNNLTKVMSMVSHELGDEEEPWVSVDDIYDIVKKLKEKKDYWEGEHSNLWFGVFGVLNDAGYGPTSTGQLISFINDIIAENEQLKKPKPKKTITCSSCGQTGHNKTSKKCPNVIDA